MSGPFHPFPRSVRGRFPGTALAVAVLTVAVLTLAGSAPVASQELPFKTGILGVESFACPTGGPSPEVSPQDHDLAARLGSTAAQAMLLGDLERARDLLRRATDLDPTSAALAYQYGRSLEETGDVDGAVSAFCRTLALEPRGEDAEDARARVLALTPDRGAPAEAIAQFRIGVLQARTGRFEEAVTSFERALAAAPSWPEAHYDRGVALARLGRDEEARTALRRYLELVPDAPDAMAVSERIGELQAVAVTDLPGPGTALALGLVPGMGQAYTGRPAEGLAFLGLAGGHAATALLYDRGVQPSFEPTGLAIAGTVTVLGAVDAFLEARRLRAGPERPPPDPGTALGLGLLPGLGQIYAGRTDVGLGVLSLVALTVTASDLLETRAVRRFAPQGLVVAGVVDLVGAGEAWFGASHMRRPPRPDPYKALALGILPGMGQFYSGRTGMGMAVLSLAAGSTAAGLIYRIGRGVTFRGEGLAIGAGVIGLGALEAFVWAWRHRGDRPGDGDGDDGARDVGSRDRGASPPGPGSFTLRGPALAGGGPGLRVRLVGVRF